MKRRKIDTRTISERRPSLTLKENAGAVLFAKSLERFANEYLRAAMRVSVSGHSTGVISVSLENAAYMLRLFVEYGGCDAVLDADITINEHITIDVRFPLGLPKMEELAYIAKAARSAGFFFEVRENRIICRAGITDHGRVPVYSGGEDKFYSYLKDMFFL